MSKWKMIAATIGLATVAAALVLAWSMEWLATLGGTPEGEELRRIQASSNYDSEAGIFINPVPTTTMSGEQGFDTLAMWLDKPADAIPPGPLPMVEPDFSAPEDGLKLTWMGHSTYVIQIDGAVVLTDPVFSERASPSSILGPKRFHPFPADIDELPKIDAIVISHDHYDHLDYRAITTLAAATDAPFLVPLGVGAHLKSWGVPDDRILLHDWWDETEIAGLTLASTPARHFSGRKGFDQFSTLWTSWSIVGSSHRVFFSGDTGLFDGLAEIAEKYGPFDVAMYEIGAYHDNWGQIHLGPDKALQSNDLIGARLAVPIHWGTFDLGLHSWWEPPTTFAQLADARDVAWSIPRIGGSIVPGKAEPRDDWWSN